MNELIQIDPISPPRQPLIDNMSMRRFSKETQRNYLRDVGRFAAWLGRSPHTASAEDIPASSSSRSRMGFTAPLARHGIGGGKAPTARNNLEIAFDTPLDVARDRAGPHEKRRRAVSAATTQNHRLYDPITVSTASQNNEFRYLSTQDAHMVTVKMVVYILPIAKTNRGSHGTGQTLYSAPARRAYP